MAINIGVTVQPSFRSPLKAYIDYSFFVKTESGQYFDPNIANVTLEKIEYFENGNIIYFFKEEEIKELEQLCYMAALGHYNKIGLNLW